MRKPGSVVSVVVLCLAVFAARSCPAQCGPFSPNPETRTWQELYENLQQLECAFATSPQADPVVIGSLRVTTKHGPLEGILVPAGHPDPEDGVPTVTLYGPDAVVAITQDRSNGDVTGYDFQVEITEVKGTAGVLFSRQNAWDHFPVKGRVAVGNELRTLYDLGEATEVSGTVYASTISTPGHPSQRAALNGGFRVRLARGEAGVFTVPVMPVSLLYAPPPGETGNNTLTYKAQQSTATKVTTTLSASGSTTVPTTYDEGFDTLKSGLDGLKSVAKIIPGVGSTVSSCLGFINTSLGSATTTREDGKLSADADGQAATAAMTRTGSIGGAYPSGPYQGQVAQPGLDDKVVVLLGVRMAWIPDRTGAVRLVPLGPAVTESSIPMRVLLHDLPLLEAAEAAQAAQTPPPPADSGAVGDLEFGTQPSTTAPKFRAVSREAIAALGRLPGLHQPTDQPMSGLDLTTVRSLLALDPLVPQAGASDPGLLLESSPRYRPIAISSVDGLNGVEEITVSSWDQAQDLEIKIEYLDTQNQSQAQFTTLVEDDKPGLLGKLLSMGPQERKTVKSTSTVSTAHEGSSSTLRTVVLHLVPPQQDSYAVRAYQDRVFGTYVFHKVEKVVPQCAGTATDASGAPAAGQWVTLDIAGHRYAARTDSAGRYTVVASNRSAGRGRISVGGRTQEVEVAPTRAGSPALRPPFLRPAPTPMPPPAAPQAPQAPPPTVQPPQSAPAPRPLVRPDRMKPMPLLSTAPPAGCDAFDPTRLAVGTFKGGWAVLDRGAQPERALATFTLLGKANADHALEVMRHYGMNQRCAVEPGFACFLSNGQAPAGPVAGETCQPFDPGALRVESRPRPSKAEAGTAGSVWAIVDGPRLLFIFGDDAGAQARAEQALALIREHGFTTLCRVGPFTYLRR